MKRMAITITLVAVFTLTLTPASATPYVVDNFPYPNGPLNGQVPCLGGVWTWNSNGGGTAGQLQVTGERAVLVQTTQGDDEYSTFANGKIAGPGDVIYAGFDLAVTGLITTNFYFAHYIVNNTTFTTRVWLTSAGPGFTLAISDDNTIGPIWPGTLQYGESYRVVIAYGYDSRISRLWVNPTLETDPSIQAVGTSSRPIKAFQLREASSAGTNTEYIDNLVVASTFADVVTGRPGNDMCSTWTSVGEGAFDFFTTNATFDGPALCMSGPNIWYCYAANCTGIANIDLTDTNYNSMLAVYDGCYCYPAMIMCCAPTICTIGVEIGHTYLIEVGGTSGAAGCGTMNITCTANGACCQPDGSCAITPPTGCPAPGIWHPEWTSCTPNPCPPPTGACCQPDGSCSITTQVNCPAPGIWHPEWTTCDPNPCPQPPTGACCVGAVCTITTEAACPGTWQGAGTDCFPNPCVPIDYYWDTTTGELGGNGYNGEWIYYPFAPDGPWYNMWWSNEFALDRQKDVTLTFSATFPLGSGNLEVAMVRSTPDWTNTSRPPLADEEQYIVREFLGTITTPGTYILPARLPYCPTWVSIDVRGNYFAIEGTITHTCLPAATGACCVGWDCSLQTQAECAAMSGRFLGAGTDCEGLVLTADPNLEIIPGGGTTHTISVPQSLTISDVDVDVVLQHPGIGNLFIRVFHGTTEVTLWYWQCGSYADIDAIFDDEGAALVCASPTTGYITPVSAGGGLLSAFDGMDASGDWTISIGNSSLSGGTLTRWSLHFNTNPCAIADTVVCEPQPPNHPNTYWYDVTPGDFGRCDFHVRVYDPNPANYTNPSLPAATWQFQVHQVGTEWWASWWDPGCVNAIFGPGATRFQFTNPNAKVWGDWRTTIGGVSDPYDVWNIDHSGHHTGETDGYGYRVHVPTFAENWYWKDCNGAAVADGYMPDFDQRQDFDGDLVQDTGYCGPTAVANSLWWFDCKFPEAGIVPDGWTPVDLVQELAEKMDTNDQNPPSPHGHLGPFSGTYPDDMQFGINTYLTAQGADDLLYVHRQLRPSFGYINQEVQKSQDVTLLVGFWHIIGVQQPADPNDPNSPWTVVWQRAGGHYLTVAGIDPLSHRVALSDPDGDWAEHGYSGVVRPAGTDHNHDGDNDPNTVNPFWEDPNNPYDHSVHNTDTYASHDYFTLLPSISPGGLLALVMDGDPTLYGELMHSEHEDENNGEYDPTIPIPEYVYWYQISQLWEDPSDPNAVPVVCQYYTEVEQAVVVSPLEDCGPQVGGLACKDVVCQVQTEQCLPKKVRHYPPQIVFPPQGIDHLSPTGGYFIIEDPYGGTQTFMITDDSPNMTVVNRQDPIDYGGYRVIQTEMVQLDLVASGGGGGGGGALAYVHLGAYHASTGSVVGSSTPGTDYPADSFFDVYVEIDIPDMGMTGLHNRTGIPLEDLGIYAVPPMGTQFQTPTLWSGVELYTPDGSPTGLRIVGVVHILPSSWVVTECECMDPNDCHSQLLDGHSCVGGCPPGYWCSQLGVSSPDGTYDDLWCECLCFQLGDMDHNYDVNGLDIQRFVDCAIYGGPDCGCGDFNGNGLVDMGDVSDFIVRLLMP